MKKLTALMLVLLAVGGAGVAFYAWRNPLALQARNERNRLIRAGFDRKVIAAPAGRLTYFEKGVGSTVILIHGPGDQAGSWSKVAPDLAETYLVQVIDLPGHGESSPESGPITLSDEVAGLDSLLQASSRGKAILVGNSIGAWVAMLYARQHPERVERIVAVNGGPLSENLLMKMVPADRQEARRIIASMQDPDSPVPSSYVLDDIVRTRQNGSMSRLLDTSADMRNYVLDDKLSTMTTPVDIVWGQADQMLPTDYPKAMEAGLPTTRITPIQRCGHIPQRECPVALTSVLKYVLRQPVPEPHISIDRKIARPKR